MSRRTMEPIVLLDVGGGTAKRTVVSRGRIIETAALNIGTRLIATDSTNRIIRCERAGQEVARSIGMDIRVGSVLSDADRDALAGRMAETLVQFLGLEPLDALADSLMLTDRPGPLPDDFRLSLSGGLAEYVFGRTGLNLGDLGPGLATSFGHCLARRPRGELLFNARAGIRATVLGAAQFSLELSGETIFLGGGLQPPLRAVPVRRVHLDWPTISDDGIRRAIQRAVDDDGPVTHQTLALAIDCPPAYGYREARRLARGVAAGLAGLGPPRAIVLVLDKNLARTVGEALVGTMPPVPFMCIDEVDVEDLDFLDIGNPVGDDTFVPVVIKGLVFGSQDRDWSDEAALTAGTTRQLST